MNEIVVVNDDMKCDSTTEGRNGNMKWWKITLE